MNDNPDAPTGIDISFDMDLADLRGSGPLMISEVAQTVIDGAQQALLVAPMVAFYRRYPDELIPIRTHRVTTLSLDFRAYPVVQCSEQVALEIWVWLMRENHQLDVYDWGRLTTMQQGYLLGSNLLPFEWTREFMDDMPPEDFVLVMTRNVAWQLPA
jgi:hypothetical protein